MEASNTAPQQRELVFCHECENEWYRSEHGLICPDCHSDFTEVIEADHDPRQADLQESPPPGLVGWGPTPFGHDNIHAPDPDEEDISGIPWRRSVLANTYMHGMMNQGPERGQGGAGQPGGAGSGLMGLVGGLLQNVVQPPTAQPGIDGNQPHSTPRGFPEQPQPLQQPNHGTFFRHGHGPGFTWTIASNTNFHEGPPNLSPRNANQPQPMQLQPENIHATLRQMLINIGGPGGFGNHPGNPMGLDDQREGYSMGPLGDLLSMIDGAQVGRYGDAVYSQQAFDRIMSQLMDEHQAGNAPGPASEAAIRRLPEKQIGKNDICDNGKAECSICMDEVPLGYSVTVLPCTHWFHRDCIKAWLGEHDTCPHCRRGIMPKDGQNSSPEHARDASQEPLHDMHDPIRSVSGQNRSSERPGSPHSDWPAIYSRWNRDDSRSSISQQRSGSAGSQSGSSREGGSGIFNRMREAFGRPSSNHGPDGQSGGNDPRP